MSSWPPTLVDWGELTPRLRAGDPVCIVHGLVEPEQAPVGIPICPRCRQAVLRVDRDQQGLLRGFAEPGPDRCSAAERHRLIGGRVLVGWTPCGCANAVPGPGGHRTWRCRECADLGRADVVILLQWPVHTAGEDPSGDR